MSVKTEVDFKWLEEKTSSEMVTAVKKVVEDKYTVLLNFRTDEYKYDVDVVHIHFITVLILTSDACHHFHYDVKRNNTSHNKMHRTLIKEFAELEAEHIDHLKKVEVQ